VKWCEKRKEDFPERQRCSADAEAGTVNNEEMRRWYGRGRSEAAAECRGTNREMKTKRDLQEAPRGDEE
jgi:hypothetical protein